MVESSVSGILYRSPNIKGKRISIELENWNNLLRLKEPQFAKDLRPPGGWKYSNEPEGHLDEIATRINEIRPKNILCTSYKDKTLATRLQHLGSGDVKISLLFDAEGGIIGAPPEECIIDFGGNINSQPSHKYDLVLCRHFLEHSRCPASLLEYLSGLVEASGFIYLEVPTIQRFIDGKVPLFIWEQHNYYFSPASLTSLSANYVSRTCFIETKGEDIEPSLCALFAKDILQNTSRCTGSEEIDSKSRLGVSAEAMVAQYKEAWTDLIRQSSGSVGLLGIGHASDRFRQWTGLSDRIAYYLDTDEAKHGLYLANSSVPISFPHRSTLSEVKTLILGVHDRDTEKVTKVLRDKGYAGKIYSIYECPR